MPDRDVTDRLDDKIVGHDGRLRVLETWTGRHEEKCEGRHKAITGQFDRIGAAIEEVRADGERTALAASKANEIASAGVAAAATGRAAILFWVRGAFGAAAGGWALWGGAQTPMGKIVLKFLGAM